MRLMIKRLKQWLSRLSFRTGIIMLVACVACYIISFAQMLLPISAVVKGVLWFMFFGLAKTFQYSGFAVIGVEGIKRLKLWLKNKRS